VDQRVLGTASGSLVVVLRWGVTDRELTEAKLDALDRVPIRSLGAVLNDIRPGLTTQHWDTKLGTRTPGRATIGRSCRDRRQNR
jgi:Mrp family chromosome partitioning ATPase